jgi:hypothetical protein
MSNKFANQTAETLEKAHHLTHHSHTTSPARDHKLGRSHESGAPGIG